MVYEAGPKIPALHHLLDGIARDPRMNKAGHLSPKVTGYILSVKDYLNIKVRDSGKLFDI
jgi:hypothetical protein